MGDLTCPFCHIDESRIVIKNKVGFVIKDIFPVTTGHSLVIPYRHHCDYFELNHEEKLGLWSLVDETKSSLDSAFNPDGFNIGINVGEAAGQTISHVHIHVIPRYTGDTPKPRGGVRGVIPEKQAY